MEGEGEGEGEGEYILCTWRKMLVLAPH